MRRKSRVVLGLNSGTSVDGVDAVACEIAGRGTEMTVRVIGHVSQGYPADLRRRLLAVMAPAETGTEEICRLHTAVGEAFATAARKAMVAMDLTRVDLVGSHGQTICHLPPRRSAATPKRRGAEMSRRRHAEWLEGENVGMLDRALKRRGKGARSKRLSRSAVDGGGVLRRAANGMSEYVGGSLANVVSGRRNRSGGEPGTLQIGDAAIVSAAVGAPVVSQFRQADMAVGGQGAPLVPWTDYVLFRDRARSRVIQNIGGIANLTYLPAGGGEGDVIAFDCGPGNMVIDALVSHFTGGRQTYDRDGKMALRGKVNDGLFAEMDLLSRSFLEMPPPRSLGREEFGARFVAELLKRHAKRRIPAANWIATATQFTADAIFLAYQLFLPSRGEELRIDDVILCGGGAKNAALVARLKWLLDSAGSGRTVAVRRMDEFGISSQAKECVSFAMLAAACVDRVPANLPQVTGATRCVVLGQVVEL